MNISLSPSNVDKTLNILSQRMSGNGVIRANPFDRAIKSLQEQIERLSRNESMDDDTKQKKIKDIEEQIKALQEERLKQQAEEMKRRRERQPQNSSQSDSGSPGANDNGLAYTMTKALVKGSMSLDSIRESNSLRVDITNQLRR